MNFTIVNMERDLSTDGVITAHYNATLIDGQDDAYSASMYGSVSFKPNPESSDFTPYEDLTEQQVVVWVKEALGREQLEEMQAVLQANIDQQKAPKVADGLPWA